MTTAVFDHPACLEHDTGFQHPESPERLRAVLEALAKPEFISISAGFDALIADPIGSPRLSNDDLAWATTEVAALARTHCSGRLVSALKGGYNPHTLGRASAAHVKALMAA